MKITGDRYFRLGSEKVLGGKYFINRDLKNNNERMGR